MLQYLVFVGATVQALTSIFYIQDILRGKTKPNRVSWLLWSVAPLIATAAALSNGVAWAVLPVFLSGFTPLITFIASFANPKAYWKLGALDYLCGFFSLLALVFWGITKEPVIVIGFAILSDFFAGVPTLIKSWHHPETESGSAYFGGLVSALSGFFAIHAWVFSEYAFLMYIVLINSAIIFSLYRRKFLWTTK